VIKPRKIIPPIHNPTDVLKLAAAEMAMGFVKPLMLLGLGSGSTASLAVRLLAESLRRGDLRDILCVPCSLETESLASSLGIPLTTLEDHPMLDLTIDGADEVDPQLNLIKGGGGALLREKIVAQSTRREIIIVDESKLSPQLGTNWAVPVEITPFGWGSQKAFLESLGARVSLRTNPDETPYKTDQGNLILDCQFGPIANAAELAVRMCERAGIVAHGLFINLTSDVIVAGKDGCRHLVRS
jgi:ribose 5-phosphate isomerase A